MAPSKNRLSNRPLDAIDELYRPPLSDPPIKSSWEWPTTHADRLLCILSLLLTVLDAAICDWLAMWAYVNFVPPFGQDLALLGILLAVTTIMLYLPLSVAGMLVLEPIFRLQRHFGWPPTAGWTWYQHVDWSANFWGLIGLVNVPVTLVVAWLFQM